MKVVIFIILVSIISSTSYAREYNTKYTCYGKEAYGYVGGQQERRSYKFTRFNNPTPKFYIVQFEGEDTLTATKDPSGYSYLFGQILELSDVLAAGSVGAGGGSASFALDRNEGTYIKTSIAIGYYNGEAIIEKGYCR